MLFLSPLFLWALAAASLPVIIHLINRRRHQTIQWAAMQFLLKASRQARGKRKLRHILILTCRCLAIAGLVAAAARPVVSGLLGWGGGSIDTVVLLLDRSASMEARPSDGLASRREILLGKVRDAMADLGNPRLVLIDSASLQAVEVASPEVLAELSVAAATDTAADIPEMLNQAAACLADVAGNSEIWLASDLQASNWNPADERWTRARAALNSMPKPPRVRVLSITGNTAANAAVRLLATSRSGDDLQLQVEVVRSGRGSLAIPLTTNLNGVTTTESLTLVEQSLVFQRTIRLPKDADSGFGWLSVPADGNPRDNVAFFAYGPAQSKASLVVAPPGEAADFLLLAAAPPGIDGLSARVVAPELAATEISPEIAAVLWAAPLPSGAAADALRQFLSMGGHVLFLPPGQPSPTTFLDVRWPAPDKAPEGSYFILGDWNHDDGLWRDGMDGTALAGERLKAILRQTPDGEVTPLARWEDGPPALARRIVDAGTAWFLTSLPDYTWSNLGDADLLLPAVQRMVDAGAARFDRAHQAEFGPAMAPLLNGPSVVRVDHHDAGNPAAGRYDAGIYDLGERLLAVNRPAAEDEPGILAPDELDAVLDGLRHSLFDQSGSADDEALSADVWRAFVIAALLFLFAEALLCLPKAVPPVVLPKTAKP